MQMVIFLAAATLIDSRFASPSYVLATCAYICFFTGLPAGALRLLRPYASSFLLRVIVIVMLPVATLLPDIIVYMWDPATFNDQYSARHVLNPFWTLSNWYLAEARLSFEVLTAMGLVGLLGYALLFSIGRRMTVRPVPIDVNNAEAPAGASRGANVLY
jgi:hypothetical protein